MKKTIIALLLATLSLATHAGGQTSAPYKNPELPVEERVADLLSRMTLEEKVGQMCCALAWNYYTISPLPVTIHPSESFKKDLAERHIGMLWGTFRADPWTQKTLTDGLNPTLAAKAANALQRYAIEHTRLGIPLFLAEEAPHGHMAIGTTVFPTGLGMAATWSPQLMEQAGAVIAREIRLQGGHISYGPVLDLARDPRWSRVEETMGEDPVLSGEMGAAMVRGLGGGNMQTPFATLATIKHFIGYGTTEAGQNGAPTVAGPHELEECLLPPFKKAIDAGALSVMTSYNTIDGTPTTSNKTLLTDILRHRWGFRGFVVSDLYSIDVIWNTHHVARNRQEAGVMALNAGVDTDLGAQAFAQLTDAVQKGMVSVDEIDKAVGRILRMKFEMGLFEHPFVDEDAAGRLVRSEAHRQVALDMARASITLLKNYNGVLPLNKTSKVLVCGPNADNVYNLLGDYTAPQDEGNVTTILSGIRAKLNAQQVSYVRGCAVRDTTTSDISAAVSAACDADVIVAVVGGSSARDFKTSYKETGAADATQQALQDIDCGEGFDRATLNPLGHQMQLLKALKATGKPLVVVYVEGRPMDKCWAAQHADALLTAYYPGQEGGKAVADVLFGDYNPAGRLPVSVPVSVGQLPVYYNKRPPMPHDYVEMSAKPLYAFGYGLSYTTFDYSNLEIEQQDPTTFHVRLNVTNSGRYDGHEVVQLYLHHDYASTAQSLMQLKKFERIFIPKGETREVNFTLTAEDLSIVNAQLQHVVQPGNIELMIGSSSDRIMLRQNLTLNPHPSPLSSDTSLLTPHSSLLNYVDPFIGTTNYSACHPGAVLPNGMMSVVPFNVMGSDLNHYDKDERWWSAPYDNTNEYFTGFAHVTLSGVGCPEMGTLLTMPTTGPLDVDYHHYGTEYADEQASPGYYAVSLKKYGVRCEVSSTLRSSAERYTFPKGEGHILLNLGAGLTNEVGGMVHRVSETEIEGYRLLGNFCYQSQAVYPIYFVMRVNKRPVSSGYWKKQPPMSGPEKDWDADNGKYKLYTAYGKELAGDDVGYYFSYDCEENEQIEVQMGVSFVSIDNARENLNAEQPLFVFDDIHHKAREQWDATLRRITVEGGTEAQRRMFYTALYHTQIHPNIIQDVNGQYPKMESSDTGTTSGNRYTVFSLWDTYRNVHQLNTLLYPDKQLDMVRSMIAMYREWGWMPRWELYGRETWTMEGDPAIPVIADTWLKGLRDFDIATAYEAFCRSATLPAKKNKMRPDIDPYLEKGYVPIGEYAADMSGDNSVSHALEYYIADAALANLAEALGKTADAKRFRQQSLGYRHYYSKESGTLRPILQNGKFLTPFNPNDGADFSNAPGFHEGSAWNYTFCVPHDVMGLAKLMGGENAFVQKLQRVFDDNLYDPANEPDIAYPYLFTYFKGEEWRTHKVVSKLIDRYYNDTPSGLPGNDDCGTLSAWLVFSMMGLYPDCPGSPYYAMTTPVFDKVTLHLDTRYYPDGDIVITPKPLKRYRISHEELKKGKY